MIQAKELRVGNYIYLNDFKTGARVSMIHEKGVRCGNRSNTYSNVEPIPLTEQWLIDLGFEKNVEECYSIEVVEGFMHLSIESDNSFAIYSDEESLKDAREACSGSYLDHVHQLQNLYFALTGKELTKQKIR